MDVGKAVAAALEPVSQPFVIDAAEVHDRGVEIVDVDPA